MQVKHLQQCLCNTLDSTAIKVIQRNIRSTAVASLFWQQENLKTLKFYKSCLHQTASKNTAAQGVQAFVIAQDKTVD